MTASANSYIYRNIQSAMAEVYRYDPGTNNLLTQTDMNGQTTTCTYDTFKRLLTEDKPLGQNPDVQYSYNNWGSLNQQNIKTITYADASTTLWKTEYFDGVGRIIQTHSNGESGNTIIESVVAYNSRGMTAKQYVTQNIGQNLNACYSGDMSAWKYTGYSYDALGRVITQINPDNTTQTHTYTVSSTGGLVWTDLVTTPGLTDGTPHQERYTYDGFSNLRIVQELADDGTTYSTTNYYYDALNNLISIHDNANNTTTINYDGLSRKKDMLDPDMGHWYYYYDSNSNLIAQVDAKNQAVNMYYDSLNRLIGKTYTTTGNPQYYVRPSDPGTYTVTFNYDCGAYGRGQRSAMVDGSGSTTYNFDARGRTLQESKTISGTAYTTGYTYDGANRVSNITYPSGETVSQSYNGRGLPYSVSGTLAGNVVLSTLYNSLGSLKELNLGNNTRTTFGYCGTGGAYDTIGGYYGRLWEIKTALQPNNTPVQQDLRFTWNPAGDLTQKYNVVEETKESYTYDFLDRLTSPSETVTPNTPGDADGDGLLDSLDSD